MMMLQVAIWVASAVAVVSMVTRSVLMLRMEEEAQWRVEADAYRLRAADSERHVWELEKRVADLWPSAAHSSDDRSAARPSHLGLAPGVSGVRAGGEGPSHVHLPEPVALSLTGEIVNWICSECLEECPAPKEPTPLSFAIIHSDDSIEVW